MVPEDSSPTPDPQAPTVDIDRLAADPTPLRASPAGGGGAFQAEDVLAERYRIVRFLARGGMGEVYEAHDHELGERVALKVIRSEIARDARAMERFRREIALARKVTHGNVCRTFDIEHHRDGRGVTAFVTMELLEGETLAERLRRAGRLSAAEALPIVRQMVAGLAAAHEAGIVHRDFKSGNVMLVPRGDGVRAVVTDFGLASGRPGPAEGTDADTSSLLVVAGTPQYMSPEQVAGGPITPASDVYALGVVLYEMVTGTLPFSGDTPLSVAVKRLQEKPAPPSDRVAGLDAAWTRTILRCLERDPQARFASVTEVAAVLEGAPLREARRRRRLLPWALAATLLALAALVRPGGFPWPAGRGASAPQRRAVAVLGFRNLNAQPQTAWLSTALAEMVASELGASPGVRVVSGEDVARMKLELGLSEPDSLGAATLARVRRNLGADFVVLGSYLAGGGPGQRVRVDVRLQDAAAGETVASVTETGAQDELSDLVSRSGERLRAHLGAPAPTDAPRRAVLPRDPAAARAYAEGLARLRVFDAAGARPLLESALAADPQFALAHSALAAAWAALGDDARARAAAQEALRLGEGLPREQRLFVEARYRESGREWDQAIALYQSLARFFPDDLDYGLRLAETQVAAGRGRDAVATVEALRRLPPPASLDARVDLAEAAAAEALADDRRAQVAAARAAQKGSQAGARLLLARARLKEGTALWRLNEQQAAAAAAEEARGIFAALGDELGVAQTLNVTGNVRRDRGDLPGAREAYAQALAIYRRLGHGAGAATALGSTALVLQQQGDLQQAQALYEQALALHRERADPRAEATVLNNLAGVLRRRGQLSAAKGMYEEALALNRRTGERRGVAMQLNNLGNVLRQQGEFAPASRMYEESLALARELGDRRGIGLLLHNLGELHRERGDLAPARRAYEEALALRRQSGDASGTASTLHGLGLLLAAQGDLAAARGRHEESLALRAQMGEKGRAAEVKLSLAELALEDGRPADAERLAAEVRAEFQRERRPEEAAALVVVARAAAASGRLAEARAAIDAASGAAERGQGLSLRLAVRLAAQRLRVRHAGLVPGPPAAVAAEAARVLERTEAEARAAGLLGVALEAALGRGEAELRGGRVAEGRARLARVEKDARARELLLVAGQAAAALAGGR